MDLTVDRELLWEKVGYKPHPRQQEFHNSKARFKVPVCGRRFGKSRMSASEALPELFRPKTAGWIVGPTYDLGAREFEYLWEDIVVTLGLGKHLKAKAFNVKTGTMYIEMPWGSRVEVKSADHPDGLVGKGLDWMIVAEAAKQRKDVWDKYLRPALADKKGWAIFPSTPEGQNWYYNLYQLGQSSPEYESWNFPSWENPYVYPGGFDDPEVQQMLASMPEDFFWQEIGASFRSVVGLIYPEWDDGVHVYEKHFGKPYEYNPAWDNYLAFDFGFTNPFVALDIQVDPQDRAYVWREWYVAKKPIHEHAMILRDRVNPEGYDVRCGFGDAADPGAVETLSMHLCPVYADSKAKDIIRGIQEVKQFLKDPNGQPRLFVSEACRNTIWEFQNYRAKQTRNDDNPKEDPKKWADHAMDALKYFFMHMYVLGGGRYSIADAMDLVPRAPVVGEVYAPTAQGGIFRTDHETVFRMTNTPRW